MTAETLAFLSAGCTFAVLLVILVGTAVRLIKRHRRSVDLSWTSMQVSVPPCQHQRLYLDACDDAICQDCGENLT